MVHTLLTREHHVKEYLCDAQNKYLFKNSVLRIFMADMVRRTIFSARRTVIAWSKGPDYMRGNSVGRVAGPVHCFEHVQCPGLTTLEASPDIGVIRKYLPEFAAGFAALGGSSGKNRLHAEASAVNNTGCKGRH